MKKLLLCLTSISLLIACNNQSEKTTNADSNTSVSTETENVAPSSGTATGKATVTYSVEGVTKTIDGAVLVQKDKSNLSPGNEKIAIVTANGSDKESLNFNFLFSLKPGTYPIVGTSFSRNVKNEKGEETGQVFGKMLGGEPAMTPYKVNVTEATNLGSNGLGGNKWKISGNVEGEITIDMMSIMKMDKSHPASIKVDKISFANLSFDDNWEELMEKANESLKK